MREVFKNICDGFEAEIVEMDGEQDHIHLLLNYPPKVAISKLVNSLKGVSSRRLRQLRRYKLRVHPLLSTRPWA